jgi:flagellar hook protein FlgE
VQGINADAAGNFTSTSSITNIQLPIGQKAPARATTQMTLTGNLDAAAAVGAQHTLGITVYDASGTPHDVQVVFTNTAPGQWDWTATSASAPITPAGNGTVTFNPSGSLGSFTYPGGGGSITLTPPGGQAFTVTIDAGTVNGINGLSGFANPSNAVVSRQDGYTAGDLMSLSVDAHGVVTGFYNNGVQRNLAQIALARFTNPSGLTRAGNNTYTETPNSGLPSVGFAGGTNTSMITAGALENSNVDISQEFTQLIIAQRGFQANARVITTADEMLNDLVNIRR